jgi:hypothetical protein
MGMESFNQSPQEVRMPDPSGQMEAFDTTTKEGVLKFAAERRATAEMKLAATHSFDGIKLDKWALEGNREAAAAAIKEAEFQEKKAEEMPD